MLIYVHKVNWFLNYVNNVKISYVDKLYYDFWINRTRKSEKVA